MAITVRVPDDEGALARDLADIRRDIRELGPSVAQSLVPVVSGLQSTIETRLAADYYTRAQVDAKIAEAIAAALAGNVNIGGNLVVSGNARINGIPAKDLTSTSNRFTVWSGPDGTLGHT